MWEDIIEADETITITWKWAPIDADDDDDPVDGPLAQAQNTSVNNPITGFVTFNNKPAYQWFFDPTPADHSEFDMKLTSYADLDSTEQLNRFEGSPPDLAESLITDDFQLEEGSAGPNLEHVGPGEGLREWRKKSEYSEWLNSARAICETFGN